MSLQGLVDATATALGGARDMYGPAVTATGLPSTAGLQSLKTDLSAAVDSVPTTWRGDGGEGYKQSGGNGVAALDNVIGADGRVGPQVVTASTDSRDGRSGMNTVVSDTRNGVNAIAPSTDTPAGKQALVNHLDGQLDRAKALLTRSQQRGQMLSAMIRNAGAGYGGAGMGGMGGGGMPMGAGMGGSMGGMSPLGALNGHRQHEVDDHSGREQAATALGAAGFDEHLIDKIAVDQSDQHTQADPVGQPACTTVFTTRLPVCHRC
jgi:hypothetical protein